MTFVTMSIFLMKLLLYLADCQCHFYRLLQSLLSVTNYSAVALHEVKQDYVLIDEEFPSYLGIRSSTHKYTGLVTATH